MGPRSIGLGHEAAALEARVDADLKRLPVPCAPPGLARKVLRTLEQRRLRPWWEHSWWEWPLTSKLAFLVVAVGIAGAFGGGNWLLDEGVARYSGEFTETLAPQGGVWDLCRTLWDAAGLLWQEAAQPRLLAWLLVVAALYFVCLGVGTAFVRTAATGLDPNQNRA